MTPIEPGEEVDEQDVINVTDEATGETKRYRRRAFGLWGFKNHAFSNDFVQGAYKKATLVKAFCGALSAASGVLGGVVWVLYTYVIAPQQKIILTSAIKEQVAPIVDRLDRDEQLFRDHLIDVASQRALYPTRVELREDIAEIKAMIQHLEDKR